ncbi:MAG: toll/interleukin-1 receptor domain-containing protein, partial [Verrucomicrobiota bacterium]
MNPPFRAYEGTEPYLFISYAHADRERVFPEMQWMQEQGYRFWFDEGIQVGSEWSERIAQAIHGCAQFLVFLTPRSAESGHVKEEIYYAYQKGKSVISIYLESTTLPEGLEMRLAPLQA